MSMEDNYTVIINGKKSIVLATFEELEIFCNYIYVKTLEIRKTTRGELALMRLRKKDIPLFENWKKDYK